MLESDSLILTIQPAQGCDITSIVDKPTGLELLFQTPWGGSHRAAGTGPWAGDSVTAWLDRYPGGWQLLLPNGGAPCSLNGIEWVFHGEASQTAWTVVEATTTALDAEVSLARAPLTIKRSVLVHGAMLAITDAVTNTGPTALNIVWGHHPAFGGEFVDDSTTVQTDAKTFTADTGAAGTILQPGATSDWPAATRSDGGTIDLSCLHGAGAGVAHFGYLSGFKSGRVRITNRRRGVTAELTWPIDELPYVWYWVENHATSGYPWFGRCHVFAFEPCSTAAAVGATEAAARNLGLIKLESQETKSVTVALNVSH